MHIMLSLCPTKFTCIILCSITLVHCRGKVRLGITYSSTQLDAVYIKLYIFLVYRGYWLVTFLYKTTIVLECCVGFCEYMTVL